MKRYRIGLYAKEMNVIVQTLGNWIHTGKGKLDYVSPSCHRYYAQKQLDDEGLHFVKGLREG